jgi:hypothetical protein
LPPPAGPPAQPPLPPELQTAGASADFRMWGMVAHLSTLAGIPFPTLGNVIGPLVVYLMKKDESRFVAFHAKQAIAAQVAVSLACWVLAMTAALTMHVCIGVVPGGLSGAIYIGALVYAVLGAIQIHSGKDFEYYYIGPWVRRWGK